MVFWAEIHPYMWSTDKQRNGIPNNIQNEKSPAWVFKNIARQRQVRRAPPIIRAKGPKSHNPFHVIDSKKRRRLECHVQLFDDIAKQGGKGRRRLLSTPHLS